MDARYRIREIGCWFLDAGCWILDAGFWILDAGYWMLGIRFEKTDFGGDKNRLIS